MSDVSCQVFEFFERNCPTHGIELEWLIEGTPLTLEGLRDPRNRVPWDDWAVLCTRFEEVVGPEETRRCGRGIVDHDFNQPVAHFAATLLDPARIYDAALRWVGGSLFRNLDFQVEVQSRARARATITIPEGARGCPAWMRMTHGSLETIPLLIGLDPAAVRARITPHRATYDIVCPPSRSLGARLRRRVRAVLAPGRLVDEFAELQQYLRAAYEASRGAESELRHLFDALPVPVALVRDDQLVYRNSTWSQLLGEQPRRLGDLVLGGRLDLAEGSELTLRGADGTPRFVEILPSIDLRWEEQPTTLVVARDRTEERLEAQRRVVQNRLASLGTLAAVVGHEINNPLAWAMGRLELARADLAEADPEELDRHLEQAWEGLEQVARITEDLHAFSRQPDDRRAVHLDQVVRGALRIAGNQIEHTATLHTDLGELPPFAGDPARLSQVVLNLVTNALRAVADTPAPRLEVRTRREGDRAVLEVADNGPGIPEALRDRIFDPFFTTDPEQGTGLGLPVCRTLVQEHDGRIDLACAEGGTTVRVELPLIPVEAPTEPAPCERGDLRVLVVDDDEDMAALFPDLLAPCRVQVCTDPHRALEQAEREPFDVLVCDVMMPGLSGPELVARLEASHPDLAGHVLFVTGGAFGDRACLEDRPVLRKPFRRRELRAALERVVEDLPGR